MIEDYGGDHWQWYIDRDGYKKHIDKIVNFFIDKKGTFIDVGCGDGLVIAMLKKNSNLITVGIDLDTIQVNYCNKIGMNNVSLCNLFDVHHTYDFVLASEVIEHIEDSLINILNKICEITNDTAYITTPNCDNHNNINKTHYAYYTKANIIESVPSNMQLLFLEEFGLSYHFALKKIEGKNGK